MGLFMRSRPAATTTERAASVEDALAARLRGPSRTAVPVTFDAALSISAVWSCAWLIADLVSTMPVDVFRTKDGIDVPMSTPTVLVTPSGENVGIEEWLAASQVSLELRGNAYAIIAGRDGRGVPTQLELVDPDAVDVRRRTSDDRIVYTIAGRQYDSFEIWHERANVLPGQLKGESVITRAARSMGVTIASEQFGSDFFRDGAHPTSVYRAKNIPEMTPAIAAAIKARILAATVDNREPLVLGNGWEVDQLQVAPGESQFIETQHLGAQHVCRFFRVPPELIGESAGSGSITYANVEQRGLHFLTYCLGPRLVRRERALSRLLPQPQFVKLNRGGLLATDLATRYRAYSTAINAKFLSQDEVRALEDREPFTAEQIQQLKDLGSGPALPNLDQANPATDPASQPAAITQGA